MWLIFFRYLNGSHRAGSGAFSAAHALGIVHAGYIATNSHGTYRAVPDAFAAANAEVCHEPVQPLRIQIILGLSDFHGT